MYNVCMNKLRRYVLIVIIAGYLFTRVLFIAQINTESYLTTRVNKYAGDPLPTVVCAPVMPMEDQTLYYTTLYAVIPSIMVLPNTDCDMQLTR